LKPWISPGLEADELGRGALVLERLARLGELDLLDAVGRQDRDLLAFELACHVGAPFRSVAWLLLLGLSRPRVAPHARIRESERSWHGDRPQRGAGNPGRRQQRPARADHRLLKKAYWMEIETVMSYIANSINPDGVRAQEITESLQKDITEELGHAQQYAQRIKELYGVVPGSLEFAAEQTYLQPPEHQTDITHVIKGVIEAETGAIEHYNRIIQETTRSTRSRRTWSSTSCATRRATAGSSRATCASTRPRGSPSSG
jgi:bacterioferritin